MTLARELVLEGEEVGQNPRWPPGLSSLLGGFTIFSTRYAGLCTIWATGGPREEAEGTWLWAEVKGEGEIRSSILDLLKWFTCFTCKVFRLKYQVVD